MKDSTTRIVPPRYVLVTAVLGSGQIIKSMKKLAGMTKAVSPTVASIGPSIVAHLAQKYSNMKQESIE